MFTLEEKAKIDELRRRVKDGLTNEDQYDDYFIIRWLHARNMNLDKAEEMLRKSLKWRKDVGADTIMEEEKVPLEVMRKFMLGAFGEDDDGCPILVLPAGRHDHKYLLETYGMEKAMKWNIFLMESVMQLLKEERKRTGKPVYAYHEIIDLEGYSYKSFMYKPAVDYIIEIQKAFDSNYPDVLKTVSVINTPKIFSLLFAILKPFIAKETLDKVTFYGKDKEEWKEGFKKKGFPMHKFPPNWGGTLEGSDEFCSAEPVWFEGPIPLKYFKEVPDPDDEGYFTVKIGARGSLELKYPSLNNNGSATVNWRFKTDSHDIGYQLSFFNDESSKEEVIIPLKRVDSHKELQKGSKTYNGKGTFTFIFDNRYSFTKSKTLKYQIELS